MGLFGAGKATRGSDYRENPSEARNIQRGAKAAKAAGHGNIGRKSAPARNIGAKGGK